MIAMCSFVIDMQKDFLPGGRLPSLVAMRAYFQTLDSHCELIARKGIIASVENLSVFFDGDRKRTTFLTA